MTYLQRSLDTPIPQSEPLDERQVPNEAGGYAYPVDDRVRFHRFLIMGSEGGSFYQDERTLTLENAKACQRHIDTFGAQAVDHIAMLARERRAPRVSTLLFTLAMGASADSEITRARALGVLPEVATTASHLEEFAGYVNSMRGWGRGLRRAVSGWYTGKDASDVAYQAIKYRNRSGWTHRDLLRKAHPEAEQGSDLWHIFEWIARGTPPPNTEPFAHIHHYIEAQECGLPRLVELITDHDLPREAIPTEHLQKDEVWSALGPKMPPVAFIRNLPALTAHKAIRPMDGWQWAADRIRNMGPTSSRPALVHPFRLLTALLVYRLGHSINGSATWDPVPQITQALDEAFDISFSAAASTGQRVYLAIDVSGSMGFHTVGKISGFTARMAASAVAMMIARREPNHLIKMFDTMPHDIHVAAHDSLSDVMQKTPQGGATDLAQPMLHAMQERIPVDCFIIATDGITWAGAIHPAKALRQYRDTMGIPARAVQLAFCANGTSIMDPLDAGTLDIPGFDAGLPTILEDFMTQT